MADKKKGKKRGGIKVNKKLTEASRAEPEQLFFKFLQLPREIRDEIFVFHFANTRVSFGNRYPFTWCTKYKVIKPAPNALAALRVCRQLYQETKTLWLRNILFSFERPDDMMDKLSALPAATLSQIQHVRTFGHPVMMTPLDLDGVRDGDPDDEGPWYPCKLAEILKLLPGLSLDTLTVLGPRLDQLAHEVLTGLVIEGNGWKELRFITPNSGMLGFARNPFIFALDDEDHQWWRKPQPSTWAATMLKRDGKKSGASVTIYQSKEDSVVGMVQNPHTRVIFEQNLTKDAADPFDSEAEEEFGIEADEDLMKSKKELMVVVKRGNGANIAERVNPPFADNDIRTWAYGMTWAEIRDKCIDYPRNHDSDSENDSDSSRDPPVEIDKYNAIDEIEWHEIELEDIASFETIQNQYDAF